MSAGWLTFAGVRANNEAPESVLFYVPGKLWLNPTPITFLRMATQTPHEQISLLERRNSTVRKFAGGRKQMRTYRLSALIIISLLGMLLSGFATVAGQTQSISLNSPDQLKLVNVRAETVTFKGRKALRLNDTAAAGVGDEGRLAVLPNTDFQDGVIEVDLTGEPAPGAGEGARGFVGIAFRVSADHSRFECIYLRPTNGRADDQVRRNHSVQYISIPGFPWNFLRKEFPEKYESYVDLVAGEWTKVKIEVRGDKARLYVNGVAQPTLLVNDLKQGQSKGAVALWIGTGTVAHFADVRISR